MNNQVNALRKQIEGMDAEYFLRAILLQAYDAGKPMFQARFRNSSGIGDLLEELARIGLGYVVSADPEKDEFTPDDSDPISPVRVVIDLEDSTRIAAPKRIIT